MSFSVLCSIFFHFHSMSSILITITPTLQWTRICISHSVLRCFFKIMSRFLFQLSRAFCLSAEKNIKLAFNTSWASVYLLLFFFIFTSYFMSFIIHGCWGIGRMEKRGCTKKFFFTKVERTKSNLLTIILNWSFLWSYKRECNEMENIDSFFLFV